jgi:hypothetical protein
MPLDMTTSFPLKIMPTIASVTHFNTSPFSTWRSAFREGVKLACSTSEENQQRLAIWCSTAHGPFAEECLSGARAGRAYGGAWRDDQAMLLRINDWDWLRAQFEATHECY